MCTFHPPACHSLPPELFSDMVEEDEMNVPLTPGLFRDKKDMVLILEDVYRRSVPLPLLLSPEIIIIIIIIVKT